MKKTVLCSLLFFATAHTASADETNGVWTERVIDSVGSGADGVHLGDFNRDGAPDITTGWEQSGQVRVYINPRGSRSMHSSKWGNVTVSSQEIDGLEDAAFTDLDGNGVLDSVVSSAEGDSKRLFIHWLADPRNILNPFSWVTTEVGANYRGSYLKARAGQIDGRGGADIVAASKDRDGDAGGVFWFRAPNNPNPGNAADWTRHLIGATTWAKSIELLDMDHDGDTDVLYGGRDGVVLYKNPGPAVLASATAPDPQWERVPIDPGTSDLILCDFDGDRVPEIIGTLGRHSAPSVARIYKQLDREARHWKAIDVISDRGLPSQDPEDFALKSVECADLNKDGKKDLAITASGNGVGVFALYAVGNPLVDPRWTLQEVAPYRTVMKYDNVLAADFDGDGDLDLTTTEENVGWFSRGLGVLIYENLLINKPH